MLLTDSDCPCSKSELSLFDARPMQTVMNSAQWVDIHPLNNVSQDNAPIEFTITGSSDEYLDLNDTLLQLTCKVVKEDGSNFVAVDAQAASPVNNWMHSIFSDVKLIMGDKQLEGGVQLHPYRALLSNILLFSNLNEGTQLSSCGFIKDTAGQMDSAANNTGHVSRLASVNNSKTIELCGPLFLDMTTQSKYLLSQMDVHIKLVRAKSSFYMFGAPGKVKILNAVLYVRRVKIEPSIILEHEKQLLTQNTIYPFQHTELLTYTIPQGSMSHNKESLFRGHMPKLVIIGMVDNGAYNGDTAKNPFNFQHFKVNHMALYKDGSSIPFRPLTPDFPNGICVREYMSLIQSLQLFNRNEDFGIHLKEFAAGGYNLFGFNLTPDLSLTDHAQPYQEGNLRLELKFAEVLAATINVIIMAVFDGKVEI